LAKKINATPPLDMFVAHANMRTQGALLSKPRSQNDRIACFAFVAAVLFKSLLVVAVAVLMFLQNYTTFLHLSSNERSFEVEHPSIEISNNTL
jgi:type IV secretory pathway component VirB8